MRKSTLFLIVASVIAVVTIVTCSKKNPTQATPPPEQIVISDQVVVVPDTTMNKIHHVDSTNYTYYFNKTATNISSLQHGQIIVNGMEEGTLRKVNSVSETADYYVVQTDSARLDEAILQGGFYSSFALEPNKVKTIKTLKGVTVKPNSKGDAFFISFDQVIYEDQGTGAQIKINGTAEYKPSVDFGVKFNNGLDTLGFIVMVSKTASLTLIANKEICLSNHFRKQ